MFLFISMYSTAFTSIPPEIIIKTFGFLLILGEIEINEKLWNKWEHWHQID